MNYYPHHIDAFHKKTKGLSLTERGVYRELLDCYYEHESPLPSDVRECANMARAATPAERKAVSTVLGKFFPVGPDGMRHNKRADEEISAYHARAASARTNGAKGGRRKEPEANRPGSVDPQKENPGGTDWVSVGFEKGAKSEPKGNPLGKLVLKESIPNGVGSRSPTEARPRATSPPTPGNKCPENQKQNGGGAWKSDDKAATEKARSLGLTAHPGESWDSLRSRITKAIAERDRAT